MHSGEHGGALKEPLMDLLTLLSKLLDPVSGQVMVPNFYSDVRAVSDEEQAAFSKLETSSYPHSIGCTQQLSDDPKDLLMRRWCRPSLSVHSIQTSTSNDSVIPRKASAKVSVRIVPDQGAAELSRSFSEFLESEFKQLHTHNTLSCRFYNVDKWWLGDPTSKFFKAAAGAIEKVWGVSPMYVREGGTIRATPFLEQALQAPAVIIPLGQSTDRAHLENERLRVENLLKGQEVMRTFFVEAAAAMGHKISTPAPTPSADKSPSSSS
eukprot:GILI01018241.1.p1 GENE.GILI01018241.1~~GILI01018241.1.p1  ORF type:complete len:296 (-),score=111.08 GILI01018241.1:170-967(-)